VPVINHVKRRDKSLYWFVRASQCKKENFIERSQSDEMQKESLIMIMMAALFIAGTASGAEFGKERPVAIVTGSEQEQPAIDGHIVAWSDNRSGNYDIFMYDLETGLEKWVCINPFFQLNPAVSAERIVWQDMRSGNGDVYMYDVVNRTESAITVAPGTRPNQTSAASTWYGRTIAMASTRYTFTT